MKDKMPRPMSEKNMDFDDKMTESTKKEMEEWDVKSSGKVGKRDLGSHGPE